MSTVNTDKTARELLYDILDALRMDSGLACRSLVKLEWRLERAFDELNSPVPAGVRSALQDLRRNMSGSELEDHIDMVALHLD